MPLRTYLYDATGADQEVSLDATLFGALHDQQLLWIDVTEFEKSDIYALAPTLRLTTESVHHLLAPGLRPRLDNYGHYFQLNIIVLQEMGNKNLPVELNFIIGKNFVLTLHRQPVEFLDSFDRRIKGDSDLGRLDASAFLAALLDWHITSFFRIIERLEAQIDVLDARALRPQHSRDLLLDLATLRQRVAFIRRTLTPHREVYAAMSRPDFQIASDMEGKDHYVLLNDRLEKAIEAIENARELLIGSFDIFTTQTALRTNEVVKVLTLVSVVLLPASLIVSITALLLKSPVYSTGSAGFWLMLAIIALIGVLTFVIARRRRWI